MSRLLPDSLSDSKSEEVRFGDFMGYGFDLPQTSQVMPSCTWDLDEDSLCSEEIDGLEALQQAVYLALNTSRYQHLIYSFDYGNDLKNLLGKDNELIRVESERLIREALLFDDRIDSVDKFSYDFAEDYVLVTFEVKSKFGKFESEVALVG